MKIDIIRVMNDPTAGWLFLVAAIVLEVCGTISMKLAQGFTHSIPSLLMFIFYGLCLGSLVLSLNTIQLNVMYAVWSGLGTAIVAAIGVYWFKEPMTLGKVICFGLIMIGIVGLNLDGVASHATPSTENSIQK